MRPTPTLKTVKLNFTISLSVDITGAVNRYTRKIPKLVIYCSSVFVLETQCSVGLTSYFSTVIVLRYLSKQDVREAATICPRPCKLTFDPLTLKVVFESRVTWPTSVPILVFLGLFVLDVRDRQTEVRCQTRIIV